MGSEVTCMDAQVPGRRIGNTRSRSRSKVTGLEVVGLVGNCSSKTLCCSMKTVWLCRDGNSWWWNENNQKGDSRQDVGASGQLISC